MLAELVEQGVLSCRSKFSRPGGRLRSCSSRLKGLDSGHEHLWNQNRTMVSVTMFDGESGPGCSFCGRLQAQVGTLLAGPGAYICDQCVATAKEVEPDTYVGSTEESWAFCHGDREHIKMRTTAPGFEACICDECVERMYERVLAPHEGQANV